MTQYSECELRITEIALAVLLSRIDCSDIPPSGRMHECCVCGTKSTWGPNWMWFGSYEDEENFLKTCSRECFEHVCNLEINNAPKARHRRGFAAN